MTGISSTENALSSASQNTRFQKWIVNGLLHMSNVHSTPFANYYEWTHDTKLHIHGNLVPTSTCVLGLKIHLVVSVLVVRSGLLYTR